MVGKYLVLHIKNKNKERYDVVVLQICGLFELFTIWVCEFLQFSNK